MLALARPIPHRRESLSRLVAERHSGLVDTDEGDRQEEHDRETMSTAG
jgi:hypothetical protein